MKKILILILVACFSATLFSQTIVSTEPSNRNMILEEFTGKTCQYCPDGHKRAQQLMVQYPGRFFAINVHQGYYAGGTPNYTTPYGNALANQAGVPGYPIGTVNRQVFDGVPLATPTNYAYDRTRWGSCANIGLYQPSCLNVAAKGMIDTVTRKLTLLVEVYYTADAVEATNKLTVAMLQNEILGPQTGGSTYYPEMMVGNLYRHMHMLRDFVNGTQWGIDVSPTTEGSFWSHIFEYNIPEQINNIPVVLENLEFIVFVAENSKTIISGAEATIDDDEIVPPMFTITATAGENGTITPDGATEYPQGESAEYTFTPDANYEVDQVLINDEPVEIEPDATGYTFPVVNENYTIHVTFKLKQGIKDVNGTAISIAPNPLNDKLFVTGMYDKLEIFSTSGQLLTTVFNQSNIDVNHLAKGVYFVKIQSNGQTCVFKVLK